MDKRINVNRLNSPNLRRMLRLEGTLHLKEMRLIPRKPTSTGRVLPFLLNKALEQEEWFLACRWCYQSRELLQHLNPLADEVTCTAVGTRIHQCIDTCSLGHQ